MANMVATFCKGFSPGEADSSRANFPVPIGSSGRTEIEAIGAVAAHTTAVAAADEDFVVVKVGAESWVKVGNAVVAADGEGWHLSAGQSKDFSVVAGDRVSVIEATTLIG